MGAKASSANEPVEEVPKIWKGWRATWDELHKKTEDEQHNLLMLLANRNKPTTMGKVNLSRLDVLATIASTIAEEAEKENPTISTDATKAFQEFILIISCFHGRGYYAHEKETVPDEMLTAIPEVCRSVFKVFPRLK